MYFSVISFQKFLNCPIWAFSENVSLEYSFNATYFSLWYRKISWDEIDISSDDRENVPEAIESENSEKVTILYGIWLLSHKLVLPLF